MNADTKAEVVDTVFSLAASLGKDFFVRRQEAQARERELEMQKEIEQVKAGARMEQGAPNSAPEKTDDPVIDALDEAADLGERYDDLLARAEAEEDCDLCRSLISAAREKPVSAQQELIPQLRDLISSVEDNASRQEMVTTINSNPALKQLLKEHMSDLQDVSSPQRDDPPGRTRDPEPRRSRTPSKQTRGTTSKSGKQQSLRRSLRSG